MASMCQPGTNGVNGSTTCQAWRTNSRRLRVAYSRSSFRRALGFANQDCKLLDFVIGKLSKLRRRTDYDRTSVGTTVFIGEVILVANDILGQKNRCGDVSLRREREQHPANGHAALGLGCFHGFSELANLSPSLQGL